MQTRIQKSIVLFFSTLLLATGLLLVNSCCDEEDQEIITTEEFEYPDPIEDLVAYLSSSMGVLMVDPEYQAEVIELLELIPTTDGRVQYSGTNTEGEPFFSDFDILTIPIPEVYLQSRLEMKLDTVQKLANGVWRRVWRNAQCGARIGKKTGRCEELPEVIPQTGAIARQHKIEQVHKRCKKGRVLCTEELRPVGTTSFYDKLCTNSSAPNGNQVDTKPFKQYRCDL